MNLALVINADCGFIEMVISMVTVWVTVVRESEVLDLKTLMAMAPELFDGILDIYDYGTG
jgi:hypothetical protein